MKKMKKLLAVALVVSAVAATSVPAPAGVIGSENRRDLTALSSDMGLDAVTAASFAISPWVGRTLVGIL